MSGSAKAGTTAERHTCELRVLIASIVRAPPKRASGESFSPLTKDLHGGRQPLPWDYFRVACQNARNPSFVLSPTFTSTPGFWGPRRFHFVRLARSLLSAAGGGERMVTTLTINSSRVEASTSDNCYSTSEFK